MNTFRKLVDPGKFEDYVHQSQNLVSALANTHDMVSVIDVATLRPIYSNTGLLYMLGYTDAEIKDIGEHWNEKIVHPDDAPILQNMIMRMGQLKPGERSRLVYRAKNPEGVWYKFESIGIALSGPEENTTDKVLTVTRLLDENTLTRSTPWGGNEEHRCKNCRKLLGIEKVLSAEIEVKCGRCGELNDFQM